MPAGWDLRVKHAPQWFRVHSLPDSKRYPDNDDELVMIISRARTVAAAVIGTTGPWYLIRSVPEPLPPYQLQNSWEIDGILLTRDFVWTNVDNDPEDAFNQVAYVAKVEALDRHFDEAIKAFSEHHTESLIWIEPTSGAVMAPYDGGIDLIVSRSISVQSLREEFSDWLSNRSDGL